MSPVAILIGLLACLGGLLAGYFFAKKMKGEAEKTIESLSAKLFAAQAENILQLAETKLSGKKELIDGSLKKMKEDLNRVETLMANLRDGHTKIDTRLENAATVIKDLTETTGGLKAALSSNSGRGQWGERMAEDVLRLSGLVEGINYIKQKMLSASGSKPDFTFLLPQNLKLNMDVKFPFNNYQLYVEAKSERDREECKKEFLKDVRKRIKEVQTRDYINPEDQTVDYVLLFIPNEQIFAFINEIDRSVVDEAMKGKTILCSPLSLFAILSVIRQSIDNFSLESKSREMLDIFGAFKQQWEKFKGQMETVKDRFDQVHRGYEELTGTRERQLDRQLDKIEEIRTERSINASAVASVVESSKSKATRKMIAVGPPVQ
jgi:DNA recombination protein RmuC